MELTEKMKVVMLIFKFSVSMLFFFTSALNLHGFQKLMLQNIDKLSSDYLPLRFALLDMFPRLWHFYISNCCQVVHLATFTSAVNLDSSLKPEQCIHLSRAITKCLRHECMTGTIKSWHEHWFFNGIFRTKGALVWSRTSNCTLSHSRSEHFIWSVVGRSRGQTFSVNYQENVQDSLGHLKLHHLLGGVKQLRFVITIVFFSICLPIQLN